MEKDMNKEKLEMLIRDLEIPVGELAAKCEFFFLAGWNAKSVTAYMQDIDKVVRQARMRLEILKKECLSPAEEETK